MEVFFTLIHI